MHIRNVSPGDSLDGSPGRWNRSPNGRSPEAIIVELAARQHGVVSRAQLRKAGLTDDMIDLRIACGLLRPLFRGVYQVGATTPRFGRLTAALLACGPFAWIGVRTAAMLWGMMTWTDDDVDVVVRGHDRRHAGIRVHRFPELRDAHVTLIDGIAVTRPARTILDLAAVAPSRDVERALSHALAMRLTTASALQRLVLRWPQRAGVRTLRELVHTQPTFTRSEAENRFLEALRRVTLPLPRVNVRVAEFEVDFLWLDERLIVEIDGFAYHGAVSAFEKDRQRDQALAARGYRVLRVTWHQLTREVDAVLVRLAQALMLAPPRDSDGLRKVGETSAAPPRGP